MADQVSQGAEGGAQGDQGQGGAAGAQDLGWRAGVAAELRDHEFLKDTKTSTEFAKKALGVLEEKKGLEAKLQGAIFKPGENATDAERANYLKAIGVPEKPEAYSFEGEKNSPKMVGWAQGVFHKAQLSKEQAALVGKEWNIFMASMEEAEQKERKESREKAEATLKAELKTEEAFKAGTELVSRLLKEAATPEELAWLNETKMGDHPVLTRLVLKLAKKVGEGTSPAGATSKEGKDQRVGFNYGKSPEPPKN